MSSGALGVRGQLAPCGSRKWHSGCRAWPSTCWAPHWLSTSIFYSTIIQSLNYLLLNSMATISTFPFILKLFNILVNVGVSDFELSFCFSKIIGRLYIFQGLSVLVEKVPSFWCLLAFLLPCVFHLNKWKGCISPWIRTNNLRHKVVFSSLFEFLPWTCIWKTVL